MIKYKKTDKIIYIDILSESILRIIRKTIRHIILINHVDEDLS
jgi:hypothetical protein